MIDHANVSNKHDYKKEHSCMYSENSSLLTTNHSALSLRK